MCHLTASPQGELLPCGLGLIARGLKGGFVCLLFLSIVGADDVNKGSNKP